MRLLTFVVGTFETSRHVRSSVATGGKPDISRTPHSEGDLNGYHHASRHCSSHSAAGPRRLVRPWTLVLNVGDLEFNRVIVPVDGEVICDEAI